MIAAFKLVGDYFRPAWTVRYGSGYRGARAPLVREAQAPGHYEQYGHEPCEKQFLQQDIPPFSTDEPEDI
jgi:hypothetical protein